VPERTLQRRRCSSFVDGFYQCEFGLVQWARYAIAAIESGLLPTINASSSFTRYRKGLSPVASPDFFLPLTWPQMTSKGWPNVFSLVARFISTNSADSGFSIFAATVIFAFFRTGSGVSEGWPVAGPSVFPPTVVVALFGTGSGVVEGGRASDSMMVREFAFSSTCPASFGGLAVAGFAAIATLLAFIAGSGLNGARFGSIGVVAAVLIKQPCEVHVCTTPRGGKGQPQPIKTAHRAPMRNGLINRFRVGKIPFPRFLEGDNEAMKINDENRRAVWG
jgi:hypothetical protein